MGFKSHPYGRIQRAARRLLDLGPLITTRTVMEWAYSDRGTRLQRVSRAYRARPTTSCRTPAVWLRLEPFDINGRAKASAKPTTGLSGCCAPAASGHAAAAPPSSVMNSRRFN
jgi:hypothetical protein